jgi:hypothetical protein
MGSALSEVPTRLESCLPQSGSDIVAFAQSSWPACESPFENNERDETNRDLP